jgi:hypothetical protein
VGCREELECDRISSNGSSNAVGEVPITTLRAWWHDTDLHDIVARVGYREERKSDEKGDYGGEHRIVGADSVDRVVNTLLARSSQHFIGPVSSMSS